MDNKYKKVLKTLSACSFLAGALTIGSNSASALGTGYSALGTTGQVRSELLGNSSSLLKGTTAFDLKGEEGKCGEGKCGEGKCGDGTDGSDDGDSGDTDHGHDHGEG